MFTGWFYVCAGEVISWFMLWEQGVESSNLSVPTSKTPVQRLILEINKSRFWGFIRLRARLGRVSNWFNPIGVGSYSVLHNPLPLIEVHYVALIVG